MLFTLSFLYQVIRAKGGNETETEYFGALVSIIILLLIVKRKEKYIKLRKIGAFGLTSFQRFCYGAVLVELYIYFLLSICHIVEIGFC